MSESSSLGQRLDSWKAIAQYLQRDLATVRRWEKTLGLPIHRVGSTGRSVFAYTREIDDWLSAAKPVAAPRDTSAPIAASAVEPPAHRWRLLILSAVALVAVVVVGVVAPKQLAAPRDVRLDVTSSELVARTPTGAERWRFRFPATFDTADLARMIHVSRGTRPGVYFATRINGRRAEERLESGTLLLLDDEGRLQRSFTFTDQVTFGGKSYGPPWALTEFAVSEGEGGHHVAVAAHHYVWQPGLVTILDDRWERRGTFVHAGWIESVRWLAPERLLIAGFSNAHDGGMIALIDAAALDGQGPEPRGSRNFCENCGINGPLKMFVFPRTELNRAAAAKFNRAAVQTLAGGRVIARTIEMTSPDGVADVVYEFTAPALELVSAKFSDRYWEMHRVLEAEGKIAHPRERCPDRNGPRQVLEWRPATGWRAIEIR